MHIQSTVPYIHIHLLISASIYIYTHIHSQPYTEKYNRICEKLIYVRAVQCTLYITMVWYGGVGIAVNSITVSI